MKISNLLVLLGLSATIGTAAVAAEVPPRLPSAKPATA